MKANFVYGPKLRPYKGAKKGLAAIIAKIIPNIWGCYWVEGPYGSSCCLAANGQSHWQRTQERVQEYNDMGIIPTVQVIL